MIINWYPGHMKKARELIEKNMKVIDVVIELRDARIPLSSSNPVIEEVTHSKPRIIVLNKADLADAEVTKAWISYYKEQGIPAIALNSKSRAPLKLLVQQVLQLASPVIEKWKSKGMKARSVRTIILGIPNVGKSTLINTLAGGASAKAANKPGETKGKQWVRLHQNLELLDTPGILWPKLEDQRGAAKLGAIGSISDDVLDMESVVQFLVETLLLHYKESFCERYKLTDDDCAKGAAAVIEIIGRKRGCLIKGGEIDLEKARKLILKEFRDGKLGLVSIDYPNEQQEAEYE